MSDKLDSFLFKKYPRLILFIVLFIVLGGLRQILFTNVNAQLGFLAGQEMYNWGGVLSYLKFLESWSIEGLIRLKWGMTVGFMIVHLVASILVLWIMFKEKQAIIWLVISYVVLFLLSAIFLGVGNLQQSELGYTMARRCMGALQSPFPLMLLIPAYKLIHHGNNYVPE